MKKKLILIVTIIMLLSLTLFAFVGCADKDKEEVTFLLDWQPNTNHTGLYVAKELGYYEDAGFDVKIEQPGDVGTSLMVASGEAEFGVDFQDCMAPNYSNNITTTAVAAIIQHNTSGIISTKASGITSPKQLEGKTYATWNLPVELAIMKQVMENDGGDFDKLNLYPDYVTDALTSMKLGQIDCAWIFEAWDLERAKLDGMEYNYFAFKDIDSRFDFYTPVIIANNDYIKNSPEKVRKFLEATKKGYEYAIQNPEESADILLKYAPELDRELVVASQKFLSTAYVDKGQEWGKFDADRWNAFYKFISDEGLVEEPIPENYGFTNEFID